MDKTADFWTQGAQTLTIGFRLPQINLIPAVERDFDFMQGTVGINRRLTIKWVGRQACHRKWPATGRVGR